MEPAAASGRKVRDPDPQAPTTPDHTLLKKRHRNHQSQEPPSTPHGQRSLRNSKISELIDNLDASSPARRTLYVLGCVQKLMKTRTHAEEFIHMKGVDRLVSIITQEGSNPSVVSACVRVFVPLSKHVEGAALTVQNLSVLRICHQQIDQPWSLEIVRDLRDAVLSCANLIAGGSLTVPLQPQANLLLAVAESFLEDNGDEDEITQHLEAVQRVHESIYAVLNSTTAHSDAAGISPESRLDACVANAFGDLELVDSFAAKLAHQRAAVVAAPFLSRVADFSPGLKSRVDQLQRRLTNFADGISGNSPSRVNESEENSSRVGSWAESLQGYCMLSRTWEALTSNDNPEHFISALVRLRVLMPVTNLLAKLVDDGSGCSDFLGPLLLCVLHGEIEDEVLSKHVVRAAVAHLEKLEPQEASPLILLGALKMIMCGANLFRSSPRLVQQELGTVVIRLVELLVPRVTWEDMRLDLEKFDVAMCTLISVACKTTTPGLAQQLLILLQLRTADDGSSLPATPLGFAISPLVQMFADTPSLQQCMAPAVAGGNKQEEFQNPSSLVAALDVVDDHMSSMSRTQMVRERLVAGLSLVQPDSFIARIIRMVGASHLHGLIMHADAPPKDVQFADALKVPLLHPQRAILMEELQSTLTANTELQDELMRVEQQVAALDPLKEALRAERAKTASLVEEVATMNKELARVRTASSSGSKKASERDVSTGGATAQADADHEASEVLESYKNVMLEVLHDTLSTQETAPTNTRDIEDRVAAQARREFVAYHQREITRIKLEAADDLMVALRNKRLENTAEKLDAMPPHAVTQQHNEAIISRQQQEIEEAGRLCQEQQSVIATLQEKVAMCEKREEESRQGFLKQLEEANSREQDLQNLVTSKVEQDRDEFTAQMSRIAAQLSKTEEQRLATDKQLSTVQEQLSTLEQRLRSKNAEITELHQERQVMHETHNELSTKLAQQEEIYKSTRQRLSSALAQAMHHAKQAQTQADPSTSSRRAEEEALASESIADLLDRFSDRVHFLQMDLDRSTQKQKTTAQELEAVSAAHKESTQALSNLQGQLSAALGDGEIDDVTGDSVEGGGAHSNLASLVQALGHKASMSRLEAQELQSRNAVLQEQLHDARKQNKAATTELARLRSLETSVGHLESQLKELHAAKQRATDLEKACAEADTKARASKHKLDELNDELNSEKLARKQSLAELHLSQQQQSEQAAKAQKSAALASSLESECEKLNSDIALLEQQLQAAETSRAAAEEQHELTRSLMSSETREREAMQEHIDILLDRVSKVSTEKRAASMEVERLQGVEQRTRSLETAKAQHAAEVSKLRESEASAQEQIVLLEESVSERDGRLADCDQVIREQETMIRQLSDSIDSLSSDNLRQADVSRNKAQKNTHYEARIEGLEASLRKTAEEYALAVDAHSSVEKKLRQDINRLRLRVGELEGILRHSGAPVDKGRYNPSKSAGGDMRGRDINSMTADLIRVQQQEQQREQEQGKVVNTSTDSLPPSFLSMHQLNESVSGIEIGDAVESEIKTQRAAMSNGHHNGDSPAKSVASPQRRAPQVSVRYREFSTASGAGIGVPVSKGGRIPSAGDSHRDSADQVSVSGTVMQMDIPSSPSFHSVLYTVHRYLAKNGARKAPPSPAMLLSGQHWSKRLSSGRST